MGQTQHKTLSDAEHSINEIANSDKSTMKLATDAVIKQSKILYEMSKSETFEQVRPQLKELTTEISKDVVNVFEKFRAENPTLVSDFVKRDSAQIKSILSSVFSGKLSEEQLTQLLNALNSSIVTFYQLIVSFSNAIFLAIGADFAIPFMTGMGFLVDKLFEFARSQNPEIAHKLYVAIYELAPKIAKQVKDKISELIKSSMNRIGSHEEVISRYKFGSADDGVEQFANYKNSTSAKSKERLFADLINILGDLLGQKIEGQSNFDKIKNLMAKLPSESDLQTKPEKERIIIQKIARAFNKQFGNEVIDPASDSDIIVSQVAEILKSLSAGMNSEFLYVIGEIRSVLKHLIVGKTMLEEVYNRLVEKIKVSTDEKNKAEIEQILNGHKELLDFFGYYINILQNLLNINISKSEAEIADLVKQLNDKDNTSLGAENFKKYIHKLLNGMAVTSLLANRINDALKSIGISLEEYMKSDNLKKLQDKITEKLSDSSLSDADIQKYYRAAQLLLTNYWRSDKIGKYIEEEKTGSAEYTSDMDKRVKLKGEIKNIIIKSFENGLIECYSDIISALRPIGRKVGSEIPITEQLEDFRSLLTRYSQDAILNKQIAWALVGAYKDAESKMKKENIMRDIKLMINSLDVIIAMDTYKSTVEYFTSLRIQLKKLAELIDKFSDSYVKKFGSEKYIGAEDDLSNVEGGADELSASFKTSSIIKAGKNFNDFFLDFDHFYRVAQIKRNLKSFSGEIDYYGEKYEALLGKSVAEKIKSIEANYTKVDTIVGNLDVVAFNTQFQVGNELAGENMTLGIKDEDAVPLVTARAGDIMKSNAREVLKKQYEARINFWKALQAIEIYLKSFTDGMIKNPEDVADIKNMLDETEIINEWYSEESGNNLATMFEYFPTYNTLGIIRDPANGDIPAFAKPITGVIDHYYEYAKNGDYKPGFPVRPTSPIWIKKVDEQLENVFKDFLLLKNLISLFVHIGNKFGKKEIHKETFMNPTQIYDALVQYLVKSAYVLNDSNNEFININSAGELTTTIATAVVANTATTINTLTDGIPDTPISINTFYKMYQIKDKITDDNALAVPHTSLIAGALRTDTQAERELERDMFVNAIKAISGKILTVIGASEMFKRPLSQMSYNPIRFIIGGDAELPKVNVDLVELYFRIPLLIQFYLELFSFRATDKSANRKKYTVDRAVKKYNPEKAAKITLVPDFNSIYGDLINLLFKIAPTNVDGNVLYDYSDEEIGNIVGEINLIYNKFVPKNKDNVIHEIIDELILEVNRRYGVVLQEEQEAFMKDRINKRAPLEYGTTDIKMKDYPILPGEEDGEFAAKKLAPSDAFISDKVTSTTINDSVLFAIKKEHSKLVEDFRCLLESSLNVRETNEMEYQGKTFKPTLSLTARKIKEVESNKEKFELICRLIRGDGIYNKFDDIKYLMFHETVVSGLNVLSAIYTTINDFYNMLKILDVDYVADLFISYLKTMRALGGNIPSIADFINSPDVAQQPAELKKVIRKIVSAVPDLTATTGVRSAIADAKWGIRSDATDPYTFVRCDTGLFAGPLDIGRYDAAAGAGAAINDSNTLLQTLKDKHKRDNRVLFNRHYIFDVFIEELYKFSSDINGLTDVKFSYDANGKKTKIIINFDKLKNHVTDMFSNISSMLEYFRPHIKEDIYLKYVNKGINGSYYYLYEKLMDEVFNNIDPEKSKTDKTLSLMADKIWTDLTFTDITTPTIITTNYTRFGDCMRGKVFYNALNEYCSIIKNQNSNNKANTYAKYPLATANGGAAAANSTTAGLRPALVDFAGMSNSYLNALAESDANVDHKVLPDLQYLARFKELYDFSDKLTLNRSLLFNFNQLLAKYINTCFDNGLKKIYINCINDFANGLLNDPVINAKHTFQDCLTVHPLGTARQRDNFYKLNDTIIPLAAAGNNILLGDGVDNTSMYGNLVLNANVTVNNLFGNRWDPTPDTILFTSLSIILKNLISVKNKTGIQLYIIDNVNDLPLYMKEKLRTSLPIFKTLFTDLINRAAFLRKVIEREDLDLRRTPITINAGIKDTAGGVVPFNNVFNNPEPNKNGQNPLNTSEYTKELLTGLCTSIVNAASSIIKSCETVIRELPDDPKYFELNKDFIKDYKANNKVDPFMPTSSLLDVMNEIKINDNKYMPFDTHDMNVTKYIYGTRSILGMIDTEVKEENIPGLYNIVNMFNFAVKQNDQLDKSRITGFIKNYIKLIREIYEQNHIKQLLKAIPEVDIDELNHTNITTIADYNTALNLFIQPEQYTLERAAATNDAAFLASTKLTYDNTDPTRGRTTVAYQIGKQMSEIISLTELYNVQKNIEKISKFVYVSRSDAINLIVLNIMDMNVMPINIHALMRSVPFANLYNYSNTFDRAIIDLLWGKNTNNANAMYRRLCEVAPPGGALPDIAPSLDSSRYTFMKLLKSPYDDFNKSLPEDLDHLNTAKDGDMYIRRLMTGDTNLELGRPKFLSDQLFNKSLFGELYFSDAEYDEHGPFTKRITDKHGDILSLYANRMDASIASIRYFTKLITDGDITGAQSNDALVKLLYNGAGAAAPNPDALLQADRQAYGNAIRNTLFHTDEAGAVGIFTELLNNLDILKNSVLKFTKFPQKICNRLLFNLYCVYGLNSVAAVGDVPDTIGATQIIRNNGATARTTAKELAHVVLTMIRHSVYTYSLLERFKIKEPFTVTNDFISDSAILLNNVGDPKLNNLILKKLGNIIANINLLNANMLDAGVNAAAMGATISDYGALYGAPVAPLITVDAGVYFKNTLNAVDIANMGYVIVDNIYTAIRDMSNKLNPTRYTLNNAGITNFMKDNNWFSTYDNRQKPQKITYLALDGDNMRENNSNQVKTIDVIDALSTNNALYLAGKVRFDSVVIRNLMFITNVYRALRLKMQKDLMYNKSIINSSLPIVKDSITEFKTNEVYKKNNKYNLEVGYAKRFK